MGGILDPSYGVAEERRARLIKRVALWGSLAVIAGLVLYFWFRNWRQEQTVKQFFSLLEQKKYQDAYAMWGCTPQTPCPYYSPERFTEDWGPSGIYKNPERMAIENVDACDTGVVFDVSYPGSDDQGLWVERKTKFISYAPWARCPGPHLQLVEFLKSRFGGGSK